MKSIVIGGVRSNIDRAWLARTLRDLLPGDGWRVTESDDLAAQPVADCAIDLEGGPRGPAPPSAGSGADIIRGEPITPEKVAHLAARLDCDPALIRRIAWLAGARPSPVAGLILAGGRSRRMGVDKAFLRLGDTTAIDVLHRQLEGWCDAIHVVTGRERIEHYRGYAVIPDEVSDQGPLMGLCSGLAASAAEVNIVVACDIPLIEPHLLASMLSRSEEDDIVIASLPASRGDQPLLGVYRKSVLPAARRLLAAGHRRVAELFAACRTARVVAEDDSWYTNLNTPREYHRFMERNPAGPAVSGEGPRAGDDFGPRVDIDVLRRRHGVVAETVQPVATEVPCTIVGNGVEVATLLCSPAHLEELAVGFLFSSALINAREDILATSVDPARWTVTCKLSRTPAPELMARRMYTSGCGRGIIYSSLSETGLRQPLDSPTRLSPEQIAGLARWLQHCSALFRDTGAVHSAALSDQGAIPRECIDDVARHCAVDKVIGRRILAGEPFEGTVLVCSGRISSEILHKARRAGIAVVVARGGPTHQAVLRARELGITLIGFARGEDFTIYSRAERVVFAAS
jgi:FdhD protein